MTDDNNDDDVGYKKPPKHTRFKTGQSGNPKGRPRGAKNFDTALSKELSSQVEIHEHGRRRKISKREAIAKQLVTKAAAGDHKCMSTTLAEARRMEEKQENGNATAITMSPEDDRVADSIIERLKARLAKGESDEDDS